MEKNEIAEIQERIEKKRTLQREIKDIQAQFSLARILGLHGLGAASSDARVRLQSFVHQYGNGSEARVPETRKSELATLKSNAERALQEFNNLNEEKQGLTAKLEALNGELMTLDCSADIKDITAQQGKIDEATKEVAALTKTIEEQQAIIASHQCARPKELYRKRQDLLAEKAIGKDVTEELQAIDKEIAAKEKKMNSAATAIDEASHTVEGLTRKLQEVKRQAESLENDKKEMIVFYLRTEAALAELDYQAIALTLGDSYARLYALDSIICQMEGSAEKSFVSGAARKFNIPVFGPNAEAGGMVFDAVSSDRAEFIREEKARLESLGVQC